MSHSGYGETIVGRLDCVALRSRKVDQQHCSGTKRAEVSLLRRQCQLSSSWAH